MHLSPSNISWLKEKSLARFLRYVVIDTQSDEEAKTYPSTMKQFDLARLLKDECLTLGLIDVELDPHCYVYATIPGTRAPFHERLGFIAHIDTAPGCSGKDVRPRVIQSYDGQDIILDKEGKHKITHEDTPALAELVGQTLVVTDGSTLLGADNKAGIAAIMTAAEFLMGHPEIERPPVRICFTPDEEVGAGTANFKKEKAQMDVAYTVDGDLPGILNKETFSANSAKINVCGVDIHPKDAKNVMVNAVKVISDIISQLPLHMSPEMTDGHEPFIHPYKLEADVAQAQLNFILRDFKTEGLDEQKQILEHLIAQTKTKYPKAQIDLEIKASYRNMLDVLERHPEVLKKLWKAVEEAGISPKWEPIRGGTDGSRLSEMGIPTPNIFTGGHNFHSIRELLSVDGMVKSIHTLLNLLEKY